MVASPESALDNTEEGMLFGIIAGRNVLSRLSEDKALLLKMKARLEKDGRMALLEAIPSLSARLSDFSSPSLRDKLVECEKRIYSKDNPLTSWGKDELEKAVRDVFEGAVIEYVDDKEDRLLSRAALEAFYRNSYFDSGIREEDFVREFENRTVKWSNTVAVIRYGF